MPEPRKVPGHASATPSAGGPERSQPAAERAGSGTGRGQPSRSSREAQASTREAQAGKSASDRSAGNRARRTGASRHRAVTRPERYLVAAAAPTDARALAAQLDQDPQIDVIRTIGREQPAGGYPPIAVIETTAERAAFLARVGHVHVEPDQRLTWPATAAPGQCGILQPGSGPVGEAQPIVVEVRDDGGGPVADAAVWLSGSGLPAVGFTGEDGRAELAVPAETVAEPAELVIQPARGCWSTRVSRPLVEPGATLTVPCERIVTTFPDFPERALDSWGARAMGFDRLPPTHRGHGVKIALVDTGVAAGHPDLIGQIADGRDVVGEDDKSWQEDMIGAGTHHAVLIAGQDDGTGVTGLAPEAEVHICRAAPGGHCADLIEALDYCIDQEIDVAMIAAGVPGQSELLAGKVAEARQHGVACVAAAGDGGGPVAHPAALPGVLSVGSVGLLGSFPQSSGLAAQLSGMPTSDGFFAPRSGSYGPGLDCCGPGVAIVSGLPPASYGLVAGTGTAATHVAAAAALVLAHHPQFRPRDGREPVVRDASRVDRLFQLIIGSCRPLPELGPFRSAAGLPDAAAALGAAPWSAPTSWQASPAEPSSGSSATRQRPADDEPARAALARLDAAMRSAGLISNGAA